MGNRMPHPALLRFALDTAPPLLPLRCFSATELSGHRVRTAPFHDHGLDLGAPPGLFLSSPIPVGGLTRSTRTPLPLSVLSIICRFTSGVRPGSA
jgi:hypothetical protein